MAFCRLHDEYWAVNLESLGLDILSSTETSKPGIISKHCLAVHKFNIVLPYIAEWTSILDRGHGSNTSHLKDLPDVCHHLSKLETPNLINVNGVDVLIPTLISLFDKMYNRIIF